jgi:hypothetical protein
LWGWWSSNHLHSDLLGCNTKPTGMKAPCSSDALVRTASHPRKFESQKYYAQPARWIPYHYVFSFPLGEGFLLGCCLTNKIKSGTCKMYYAVSLKHSLFSWEGDKFVGVAIIISYTLLVLKMHHVHVKTEKGTSYFKLWCERCNV